jgi:pathogenesis-related protein 1
MFLLAAGVAVVVAILAAAAQGPIGGPQKLTRDEEEQIVRAHNQWRAKVGLLPLRWGAELASRAQNRAESLAAHGCAVEHGLLPRDIGENIFRVQPLRAAGRPDAMAGIAPSQVVDTWGSESADYSYARNTCMADRQCGHYTQIVWQSTEEVGCGRAICRSLGQVWVCNYRPAGNLEGHRPY